MTIGESRIVKELSDEAAQARRAQDYRRAADLYHRLADIDPREPRHAHQAGELYIRLGRRFEALELLRRAVLLYETAGFLARAIATARIGLGVAPSDLHLREMLGTLLTIRQNEKWGASPAEPAAGRVAAWDGRDGAPNMLPPSAWMKSAV